MNIENLADTIVPKSDQLNFDDMITGPITVSVTGVNRGQPDQPISISIDGGRQPYKPCKSMRRVIISLWGEDGRAWVGRSMTLYGDPEVMFGGKKVGGIRISHMSDIANDTQLMITTTRGKKSPFMVRKMNQQAQPATQKPEYPAEKFSENLSVWVKAITEKKITIEAVAARCNIDFVFTDQQLDALKEAVISASQSGQQQPQADSIQEF